MSQSQNNQTLMQREHPKPRGRFTGQRLKVIRPDTYRRVVELLAEPREHVPYDHICRLLHVSEHTVKAIEKAESASIAERKQRLLAKALRIASKAADRIEDQIGGANITQATVAFGVATDKVIALSSQDPLSTVQQHLHLHLQPNDVTSTFNNLLRSLEEKARALPPSPPPALTDESTGTEQRESHSA